MNNLEAIEYLIKKRGISPLESNREGMNCVHFAAQMENLLALKFLMEGYFHPHMDGLIDQDAEDVLFDIYNCPWVVQGLQALDRSTRTLGFTPFHLAASIGEYIYIYIYILTIGNIEIIEYMVEIITRRENITIRGKHQQPIHFLRKSEVLECLAIENLTPLLVAAKYNRFPIMHYLYNLGVSIYVSTSQMLNALHYSILNQNEEMTKFLISADGDYNKLKYEHDCRGNLPKDLQPNKTIQEKESNEDPLANIWECAVLGDIPKIYKIIKHKKYGVNDQTYTTQNTPLHLAVIYENLSACQLLLELGADVNIININGQTPGELAEEKEGLYFKMHAKEIFDDEGKTQVIIETIKDITQRRPSNITDESSMKNYLENKFNEYLGGKLEVPIRGSTVSLVSPCMYIYIYIYCRGTSENRRFYR